MFKRRILVWALLVFSTLCLEGFPADQQVSTATEAGESPARFSMALGGNIGTAFLYPYLKLQVALLPHFSLGVGINYAASYQDPFGVYAFGGFATLNYYSQASFSGLWVQAGGGPTGFTVTGDSKKQTGSGSVWLATVGWRGSLETVIHVGLGAGIQYVTDPHLSLITPTTLGVKPILVCELGVNF